MISAAAVRLLRLDADQIANCLSLLMCQVTCPGEIKYSADTVLRAVRESFRPRRRSSPPNWRAPACAGSKVQVTGGEVQTMLA